MDYSNDQSNFLMVRMLENLEAIKSFYADRHTSAHFEFDKCKLVVSRNIHHYRMKADLAKKCGLTNAIDDARLYAGIKKDN